MRTEEHTTRSPAAKTGFFATLPAFFHLPGGNAPSPSALALAALASALLLFPAPASASKGIAYSFADQFNNPSGVAVDDASGDVYVADEGNNRIEEFDRDGALLRAFGQDVVESGPDNNGTGYEICVPADGDVCKAGISTAATGGAMYRPASIAVSQQTGDLYVVNQGLLRVEEFDSEGHFLRAFGQDVVESGPDNHGSGYEVCEAAEGDVCKAGIGAATGGAFGGGEYAAFPGKLAIAPVGAPNVGDLLVTDPENYRVEEFSPTGAFLRAFGWHVDAAEPKEEFQLCTSSAACQAGSAGSGVGQFETLRASQGALRGVAEDAAGDIYTAEVESRVQRFTLPADLLTPQGAFDPAELTGRDVEGGAFTVDPASGDVYVARLFEPGEGTPPVPGPQNEDRILRLSAAGALLETDLTEPRVVYVNGLAYVPASGRLYLSEGGESPRVLILDTPHTPSATIAAPGATTATTAVLNGEVDPDEYPAAYRFESSSNGGATWQQGPEVTLPFTDSASHPVSQLLTGLEPNAHYEVRLHAYDPAVPTSASTSTEEPFATATRPPLVGPGHASQITATTARLNASVNPSNSPTTYRFQYATAAYYEAHGQAYEASAPEPEASAGSLDKPLEATASLSELAPDTTYHFRLLASGAGTAQGPDRTFTTLPAAAPCPNESLREESDLDPLTGHPYSLALPECRAYELASPPYTEGFGLATPNISADGEHLFSDNNFGTFAGLEATGTAFNRAYELSRAASGWSVEALNPPAHDPRFEGEVEVIPGGVSADLARTLWWAGETPRSSPHSREIEEDFQRIYRREPGPGGEPRFAEVGPWQPGPLEGAHWTFFAGASRDLGHVLLELIKERWPGDATPPGGFSDEVHSLYEYVGTGNPEPRLVAVNNEGRLEGSPHVNEGAELISRCGAVLGSGSEEGETTNQGAISADGETILFTAKACHEHAGEPPVNELYARLGGEKTLDLSEPPLTGPLAVPGRACTGLCAEDEEESGGHHRSPALYQGASEDGSKVFFTTAQPLVNADKDATNDLYMAEIGGQGASAHLSGLTMLSAGETEAAEPGEDDPAPGEGAKLLGVSATSQDASHVYFVAAGVLTEAPNSEGALAAAGERNLYVYDTATGRTAFIATLQSAAEEAAAHTACNAASGNEKAICQGTLIPQFLQIWHPEPEGAQATPDGGFFVFKSLARLTADDTSGPLAPQLFRYDAQTGALVRVSVGEGGFDEDGNTSLALEAPEISGSQTGGQGDSPLGPDRHTIDSRGDVFFESKAPLSPHDLSGKGNVYEYSSSAADVFLISDGRDSSENSSLDGSEISTGSSLLGTDPSGADVYILTNDQLTAADGDTQRSLYDARREGGFPAASRLSCEGEACKPPHSAAPAEQGAATPRFEGPGNPSEKPPLKCRPGFVKKHGHCVKKPKHRKKHHKSKRLHARRSAHSNRRAGL